jgi:prepilin-type processing-associated H-X9-DG protein
MAMVRPLTSIPKELALKAMEAAERTKILSDAKQVALGLIMYSSDHDDTLPGNGGDWASLISPYLRNNSLMDGFVYTFAGGNLADVQDPAKTEIGYKSGPGGRAVAYADGHVRWIPDN